MRSIQDRYTLNIALALPTSMDRIREASYAPIWGSSAPQVAT